MEETPKKCKNLGCMQTYYESQNSDTACKYHKGPVIFHDVKKGYSCCNQVVYDWDDFQKIAGCQVGRHSEVSQQPNFFKSNTVSNAEKAIQNQPQTQVKSIDDLEREMAEKRRKEAEEKKDKEPEPVRSKEGLLVCGNFGCGKPFAEEENTEGACSYHSQGPGFHDVKKFWPCCNQEAWEWEDFMKITPCSVGKHSIKYKK